MASSFCQLSAVIGSFQPYRSRRMIRTPHAATRIAGCAADRAAPPAAGAGPPRRLGQPGNSVSRAPLGHPAAYRSLTTMWYSRTSCSPRAASRPPIRCVWASSIGVSANPCRKSSKTERSFIANTSSSQMCSACNGNVGRVFQLVHPSGRVMLRSSRLRHKPGGPNVPPCVPLFPERAAHGGGQFRRHSAWAVPGKMVRRTVRQFFLATGIR